MVRTTYTSTDNSSIKLFEKSLIPEALKESQVGQFIGSLIEVKEELVRSSGDNITFQLDVNLTGVGETEGEATDNNEEKMVKYTDSLVVNEIYKAVLIDSSTSIGAKRIGWDDKKRGYNNIKKWHTANLDISFFNTLAGNASTTIAGSYVDGRSYIGKDLIKATGFNTAIPPSTGRIVRAGGVATDESLTANNTFNLSLIDAAKEIAKMATPYIEPIRIKGRDMYVCFISEEQYTDLRRDTSSPVQWLDLATARLQAGDIESNPIMTGEGGVYNSTLIVSSTRIPPGVHSITKSPVLNTRRALFCGKGAVVAAVNSDGKDPKAHFHEEYKNGGRELQINGGMIFGMKKASFNNQDYGVVTITTYAAPHIS